MKGLPFELAVGLPDQHSGRDGECHEKERQECLQAPFIEAFGKSAILPVFFDKLTADPQRELDRVCEFIGYKGKAQWDPQASQLNVSAQRVRKFLLYDVLVNHPAGTWLRRTFVPKIVRKKIRHSLTMRGRPKLKETTRMKLEKMFDQDLAILGSWFGIKLNCKNINAVTSENSVSWK